MANFINDDALSNHSLSSEEDIALSSEYDSDSSSSSDEAPVSRQKPVFSGPKTLDAIMQAVRACGTDSSSVPISKKLEAKLFPHQVAGFSWLVSLRRKNLSGILADEMGLGKTIQTIALLAHCQNNGERGPFLVVAPLSTLSNWADEFSKFAPTIAVMTYAGTAEDREEKRRNIVDHIMQNNSKSERNDPKSLPFDVLVTNYEIADKEKAFLKRFKWRVAVVDEAQRLKNAKTVLYQTLKVEYQVKMWVLLSGTPVQNNLRELWSLLAFVAPKIFGDDEAFLRIFQEGKNVRSVNPARVDSLHEIMRHLILRRTKLQVAPDLPDISEFIIWTELVPMQRTLYQAIIRKQSNVLGTKAQRSVSTLQNVLLQLRKCCCHPYLFEGMEPEPFHEGDHIFENSAKLLALDKLLPKLKADGHRVLVFSQFVHMLDVVQDYCTYKNWSYERLDGSVRSEERNMAIQRFTKSEEDDSFLFLLSTRAGGLGLNLVAADTVVFIDSDFNPTADMQAMARAHRYGQKNNVRVYRLVTQHTVEEAILARVMDKLKLQHTVVDKAGLSGTDDIQSVVQFGLRHVCEDTRQAANVDDVLENAMPIDLLNNEQKTGADDRLHVGSVNTDDTRALDNLIQAPPVEDTGVLALRKRNIDVDDDALEHAAVERKRQRAARASERKEKMWIDNGYVSTALDLGDTVADDLDLVDRTDAMHFVLGNAATPFGVRDKPSIIICAVDDSGGWGRGGLFTALHQEFGDVPGDAYEVAGKMKDLEMGGAHLVAMNDSVYVALCVAMKWSNHQIMLDTASLTTALKRVARAAVNLHATVHTPRLGARGTGDWYSAERIFRRHVVSQGVSVNVYYYNPALIKQRARVPRSATTTTGSSSRSTLAQDIYVFIHAVDSPADQEMIRRNVADLGGTIGYDLAQTTHIVTSLQGWDRTMINAVLSNPSLRCVGPAWIRGWTRASIPDALQFSVKTGTIFKGVRIAVVVGDQAKSSEIGTNIITYGGIVTVASPRFLVTDCLLDAPRNKSILESSPNLRIVSPGWIDACIDGDCLLNAESELARFTIKMQKQRTIPTDKFYQD